VADLIELTPRGGRKVSEAEAASREESVDAAGYSSLELVLTALAIGEALQVRVETAMSLDAPEWRSLGIFTPLVAFGTSDARRFDGVLRFVRWRVEKLTGGTAVFTIAGTAV